MKMITMIFFSENCNNNRILENVIDKVYIEDLFIYDIISLFVL